MFRCSCFVIAALIAVGSMSDATGQLFCSGQESLCEPSVLPGDWAMPADENLFAVPETNCPDTWELSPNITVRLRGRIDADAIWADQSPANVATFGTIDDVVGLRRARIGVEGELGTQGRYIAEIDLPTGVVIPRDVYVAFGDPKGGIEGQFGHFREPFSLEGGTSARFFAFMERSPVNMLDPARNWGAGLFHENFDASSSLALGAFFSGTDTSDFQGGDGSTVGLTGRYTTAVINEGDGERLLHFGLALSERVPENGVIVINQQPRSSLLEFGDSSTSPFVPKIQIPATFQQLVNLQFAAANGPAWAQAEWYGSLIDQTGGGLVFFHGCYVDCGYFLTGEHRAYSTVSGTLGAVRVRRPVLGVAATDKRERGWGAWELAARYSYLDFFDSDTPPGPQGQAIGIRMPFATFGVNWYLSDQVRLMFNYSYAEPNEINTGKSSASIFASRLGIYW